MWYVGNINAVGSTIKKRLSVKVTVVANQLVIYSTTTNDFGSVDTATTTSFVNAAGVISEAVTYSTTAADMTGTSLVNGRAGEVFLSPAAIFGANASGGATAATALAAASGGNILVTTGASRTVISDVNVGTTSMVGGWIYGLTGANPGQQRIMTSQVNSTSTTVTVPFANVSVSGDRFLRVPWSFGVQALQSTTNADEADATIATGTGGNAIVVDVVVDTSQSATVPSAAVQFVLRDHLFNPI